MVIINQKDIMKNKQYYSTGELAKILGISRVAVLKKIKKGQLRAEKIGRNFAISKKELEIILGGSMSKKDKNIIDRAVRKTVKEYGQTLKLLGAE